MLLKTQLTTIASQVKPLLFQARNVVVVTHYNPDGDAIGSSLGLYWYLKAKGHQVNVVVPNEFPEFLKWLKGSESVMIFSQKGEDVKKILNSANLIICADFNNLSRLKGLGEEIMKSQAARLLIDHHPYPENVFQLQYSDTSASSTCELVFRLITTIDTLDAVSSVVAECIYTGLMTDTGCFSHNANHPDTFRVVANLIERGVDRDKAFNHIYNNFSENRMKLMGFCLNEKLTVLPDLYAAYIWLTKEELNKFGFQPGDTEGFVNLPFAIKGVYISALFTEKDDLIRVSLRSKGGYAVNTLSEKNFEGGGHKNAAGGESKLPIEHVIKKFINALEFDRENIKNTYL